jgi:hypothetical protein
VLHLSNVYLWKQLDYIKKTIIDCLIQQIRRVSRISLWKTWSNVWDMMVVEEWLIRTCPWWTMHRRRASRISKSEESTSHEESHISKCQYLLNQDWKVSWRSKVKFDHMDWSLPITTSKSQCQSKIIYDISH